MSGHLLRKLQKLELFNNFKRFKYWLFKNFPGFVYLGLCVNGEFEFESEWGVYAQSAWIEAIFRSRTCTVV